MTRTLFLLLLPIIAASCQSTTVDDEFADFEPIIRSEKESSEAKARKMFASYDPSKKSAFDGKEFKGKEASLRSTYETKDYFEEHPYFKLHQNKSMAEKVFRKNDAREGDMTAPWQGEEDSWFKRTFAKKSSRDREKQIARESAFLPENQSDWQGQRNRYEREKFPVKIVDEPNKDKQLTREDLRALLNTR